MGIIALISHCFVILIIIIALFFTFFLLFIFSFSFFVAEINGKVVNGIIKEKEQAKDMYVMILFR